jgi:hypothetical protein
MRVRTDAGNVESYLPLNWKIMSLSLANPLARRNLTDSKK